MLKRIKRAVKALTTGDDVLPRLSFDMSKLTPEQFESLSHGSVITIPRESLKEETEGDGKAEFLGEGTQEEFLESEREKKGFKGIFGL